MSDDETLATLMADIEAVKDKQTSEPAAVAVPAAVVAKPEVKPKAVETATLRPRNKPKLKPSEAKAPVSEPAAATAAAAEVVPKPNASAKDKANGKSDEKSPLVAAPPAEPKLTGPLASLQKSVQEHLKAVDQHNWLPDKCCKILGTDLHKMSPHPFGDGAMLYLHHDVPMVRLSDFLADMSGNLYTVAGVLLNVTTAVSPTLGLGTRPVVPPIDKRYKLAEISKRIGKAELFADDSTSLTETGVPFFSQFFVPLEAVLSRVTIHERMTGGFGREGKDRAVVSDCPLGTEVGQFSGIPATHLKIMQKFKDFCKRVQHLMARSIEAFELARANNALLDDEDDVAEMAGDEGGGGGDEKESEDRARFAASYKAATPYTRFLIVSLQNLYRAVMTAEKRKRGPGAKAASDDGAAEAEERPAKKAKSTTDDDGDKKSDKHKAKAKPKAKAAAAAAAADNNAEDDKPKAKVKPKAKAQVPVHDGDEEEDASWDAETTPNGDDEDAGMSESITKGKDKPKAKAAAKPSPKTKAKSSASAATPMVVDDDNEAETASEGEDDSGSFD